MSVCTYVVVQVTGEAAAVVATLEGSTAAGSIASTAAAVVSTGVTGSTGASVGSIASLPATTDGTVSSEDGVTPDAASAAADASTGLGAVATGTVGVTGAAGSEGPAGNENPTSNVILQCQQRPRANACIAIGTRAADEGKTL